MHAALYRPNRVHTDINSTVLDKVGFFVANATTTFLNITNVLSNNNIWKERLFNLGAYGTYEAISYGLTGVMLRCTGIKKDIRFNKSTTYGNYYFLNGKSYVAKNGDSFDRYNLRLYEMFESVDIVNKCLETVTSNKSTRTNKFVNYRNMWVGNANKQINCFGETKMEDLINHFKY